VVVAETLTHCGCPYEYPSSAWVQALDGGKRERCDRLGNRPIIDRQGDLSDGNCGADGRCFIMDRVYRKAKLNQNRSPADRSGVIRGLETGSFSERETAAAMVAAGLDNG